MTVTEKIGMLGPNALARLPLLSRLAFDFAFLIAKWQIRSSTRRSLQKLDDHLLQDIGLDARDAQDEYTKRFWQS
jgi:uncharacterized protein YjiS (DUF1127 family)